MEKRLIKRESYRKRGRIFDLVFWSSRRKLRKKTKKGENKSSLGGCLKERSFVLVEGKRQVSQKQGGDFYFKKKKGNKQKRKRG